jgi:hypothetical protein
MGYGVAACAFSAVKPLKLPRIAQMVQANTRERSDIF